MPTTPPTRPLGARRVVVYELNEVPWSVIDLHAARHPRSHLAQLLEDGLCLTTVDDDPVPLQPWRTWPTFHRSMYADEHGWLDLGQDPATATGIDLWDAAAAAGRRVGLVGPLQSWPPRRFPGGFHVPDTFARTADTEPTALGRFQALNLAMTAENSFASDARLPLREMAMAGGGLLRRGLTPWSVSRIARHLAQERRDPRYKAARPIMQVLPSFDLYWWLHRHYAPDLGVFFTNHVAAMMHRFWGDGVPGYADGQHYQPDPVYGRFIDEAMGLFDHQLGRMRRSLDGTDTVLVVASSMGQGPIEYRHIGDTYVLAEPERLLSAIGLAGSEAGLAMYPRISAELVGDIGEACAAIESVHTRRGPLFSDVRVHGSTVSFQIAYRHGSEPLDTGLTWVPAGGDAERARTGDIAELGVVVRPRPGGGNTAYHIPEGILIAVGQGVAASDDRREVSILDAAPSLLAVLGVDPPPAMRGAATLFA